MNSIFVVVFLSNLYADAFSVVDTLLHAFQKTESFVSHLNIYMKEGDRQIKKIQMKPDKNRWGCIWESHYYLKRTVINSVPVFHLSAWNLNTLQSVCTTFNDNSVYAPIAQTTM